MIIRELHEENKQRLMRLQAKHFHPMPASGPPLRSVVAAGCIGAGTFELGGHVVVGDQPQVFAPSAIRERCRIWGCAP